MILETNIFGEGAHTFTAELNLFGFSLRNFRKEIIFRIFKLIPIIKSVNSLQLGQPIILDASQSFDERDYSSLDTSGMEPMKYKWKCPGTLESICMNFFLLFS